jgi:nicotinate-nucleotide adenylyltransferase
MGGTFDPIHLGHLRAAETAREALELDQVLFVPAGQPPHRELPLASALDRYTMVGLAAAEHARFVASDVELLRDGPSFTVDTLDTLRGGCPTNELVLIVGSDTFPEMRGWRDAERVFALSAVAVVTRPGAAAADLADARVSHVSGPGLDISSSAIRLLRKQHKSVHYLVPPSVADYIEKRGLYL